MDFRNHCLLHQRMACRYALRIGHSSSRLSDSYADRTGERFFHLAVPWWGVIVAYIIGTTTMSIAGRYIAMFLMASGYAGTSLRIGERRPTRSTLPTGFALTLVWVSNAIPRPPAKRSAAMGVVNGFGNLGNLYVARNPHSLFRLLAFGHAKHGSYGAQDRLVRLEGRVGTRLPSVDVYRHRWVCRRDRSRDQ